MKGKWRQTDSNFTLKQKEGAQCLDELIFIDKLKKKKKGCVKVQLNPKKSEVLKGCT